MMTSRFFHEVEDNSRIEQQDEITNKMIINNYHLVLSREETINNAILTCERLELTKPVKFTNCEFSNLHLLVLDFVPSETYRPFNSCSFNHPINLVFKEPITIELPSSVSVSSTDAQEAPIEMIQNGKTTTIDQISWIPYEYNSKVKVKYGTRTSTFLDDYSLRFYLLKVEFEEDPEIIMEPTTLTVVSNGCRIGQVEVEIDDHPFSLAVLKSDEPFLNFNQEIPDGWSMNVHPSALKRMSKIQGLTILKGIGNRALANLHLNLHSLEVGSEIGSRAFDGSTGTIANLIVGNLLKDSLEGTYLSFKMIHVSTVETGAKLEANLISLASASQFHTVEDAKTLVIREKFDVPICLSDKSITRIDFRTVDSPGPFIIQGFDEQNLTFLKPDICSRIIYGTIKAPPGDEAYRTIVRKVVQSYPEVTHMDQVQVTFDGEQIDRDSWIEDDGLAEVKIDGTVVSRQAVHIDKSEKIWFYSFWALISALTVARMFY